jgi:c-di-GMP-binding flagellar brake protein YcgR
MTTVCGGRKIQTTGFCRRGLACEKNITKAFLPGARMAYNDIQRRKYERYDFCSKIDYVLIQGDTEEIFKGVTIDISPAGLRLYLFAPHHKGQGIRIKSKLPVDSQTATICWIHKCDGDLFEVGLKYTDSIDSR